MHFATREAAEHELFCRAGHPELEGIDRLELEGLVLAEMHKAGYADVRYVGLAGPLRIIPNWRILRIGGKVDVAFLQSKPIMEMQKRYYLRKTRFH